MPPYKHPPLLFFVVMAIARVTWADLCPTKDCVCDQTEPNKVVILCKDKGFTKVPTFEESDLLFYELTLENNELTLIQEEAFANIRIQRLVLTNNPIIGFSDNAFQGLEDDLEVLLLDGEKGGQTTVPEVISSLHNLKTLQLRYFSLTDSSLPTGLLNNLEDLTELFVHSTSLNTLSVDDLQGVRGSLQLLDLKENAFTAIPHVALATLTQSFTLNMAQNQIETLVGGSFEGVTKLQHLDLSANVLSINERAFDGLEDSLFSINMHSCQLNNKALESLKGLSSLQDIRLHTNQIDRIASNAFEEMDQLESVDLGGNQMNSLSKAMFNGVADTLQSLDVSDNSGMQIHSETFSDFTDLSELILDESDVSQLNELSFASLVGSLRRLSVKNSGLDDTFWPVVKPLSQLETLQLSDNGFTNLAEMGFEKFTKLTSLELDGNQLSEVTQRGTFGLQNSLEELNLLSNELTTLSTCVLNPQDFTSMDIFKLMLTDNPLECDCRLGWLHDWLMSERNDLRFYTVNWRCAGSNALFRDLDRADLVCDPPEDDPICEDLAPATTTTVVPPTTISNQPISIQVNDTTASSIAVQWEVPTPPVIEYFTLEYWVQNSQDQPEEIPVPRDSRFRDIQDLRSSTTYQICVTMQTSSMYHLATRACTEGQTQEGGEGVGGTVDAQLQGILGAVFGTIGFVIIVVVIVCCVRRAQKDVSFDGGELNKIPKVAPTVGYNSKRFSREKPRHWQVQDAMSKMDIDQAMQNARNKDLELQDKIDGFTPEERERVLQMLRKSGGSTLSVVSATSSHRYVPEPPPCRGAEGYTNPVDIRDEHGVLPYEELPHTYEEIPADTYDQIPCDSYI